MGFFKNKNIIFLSIAGIIFLFSLCWFSINIFHYFSLKVSSKDYLYHVNSFSSNTTILPLQTKFTYQSIIKGVYMTGWSAGTKNYLNYLDKTLKNTQINAVVIDVKDSSGIVSYDTSVPKVKDYKAYHAEIFDIDTLIKKFHDEGIYVIGRIAVFEDPTLAQHRPDLAVYDISKTKDASHPVLWKDNNGLSWVDPAAPEVYDYDISIAKDAASHGFDEINFDYVRFPTDGQKGTMGFPVWDKKLPKNMVIKNFFKKVRDSLPDTKISADLFGQTTTNTDDMGIGQIFEDALGYFDYVCPMVYPSHYVNGFMGYKNPADYPYQIIKNAMDSALDRQKVYAKINPTQKIAAIRPWLQDFNVGAIYDSGMVAKETQAVVDSTGKNFSGFLFWNPENKYDSLQQVLPK